jgi:hypothetical protein
MPGQANKENADDSLALSLTRLQESAIKTAAASLSLVDIEKAANIAALAAQTEKNLRDGQNQRSLLRFEAFKSWAAILVPFLSIVTLFVTIAMQYAQLGATREASADTQWRENEKNVLEQLRGPTPDPLLATSLLQSYIGDPRYGRQAIDLSLLVLSNVPSSEVFKDYFVSRKIEVNLETLASILALDRSLWRRHTDINEFLADKDPNTMGTHGYPPSLSREQALAIEKALLTELTFLSGEIGGFIKTQNGRNESLDLRRVLLTNADLAGSNFGDALLEDSQMENLNLDGANLGAIVRYADSAWFGSNWWDAKAINPPLLEFLMKSWYPYHSPDFNYPTRPPLKEAYTEKVLGLCRKSGLHCETNKILYGAPAAKNVP